MMQTIQMAVACMAVLVTTAGQVQAGLIRFSIEGNSNDWPWQGRSFEPGTITGILNGLVDNANGQIPTSIEFTSDVSALGITSNVVTSTVTEGGIDIGGGEVLGTTSLLFNFVDPSIGAMQFRLNFDSRNILHWNGSSGPMAGMGNGNGFGGATYSAVPEPTSLVMCAIGACVASLGTACRRQREKQRVAITA